MRAAIAPTLLLMLVLIVSCGQVPFDSLGAHTYIDLSMTADQSYGAALKTLPSSSVMSRDAFTGREVHTITGHLDWQEIIFEPFKPENRGQAVGSFEPTEFFAGLGVTLLQSDTFDESVNGFYISLYDDRIRFDDYPEGMYPQEYDNREWIVSHGGGYPTGVRHTFDFMGSGRFLRNYEVTRDVWEGIQLMLETINVSYSVPYVVEGVTHQFSDLDPNGTGTVADVLVVTHQYVSVDLGPEYSGVRLIQELDPAVLLDVDTDPRLHYFDFGILIPYDPGGIRPYGVDPYSGAFEFGGWSPSWLTFWENLVEPAVHTFTSESNPTYEIVGMAFPGVEYDFTTYVDPLITLVFDFSELLTLYDSNTPGDPSDDVIALDFINPLDFEVVIAERDEVDAYTSEAGAPDAVRYAQLTTRFVGSCYGAEQRNYLHWVNPRNDDLDKVTVVRKEGSPPTSITDGTVIYSGFYPACIDFTATVFGDYQYALFAVDFDGNVSQPVVVDEYNCYRTDIDVTPFLVPPGS